MASIGKCSLVLPRGWHNMGEWFAPWPGGVAAPPISQVRALCVVGKGVCRAHASGGRAGGFVDLGLALAGV